MEITALIVLCIIAALLALSLRGQRPEFAMLLSLGCGLFVLLYLFFLLVMGIPVMTIEFSLGRASQKSPVRLYQALAPKGSKWYLHGYVAMAGNYIIMMLLAGCCNTLLKRLREHLPAWTYSK